MMTPMTCLSKVFFAGACVALGIGCVEPPQEKGGLSFDFPALSAKRFGLTDAVSGASSLKTTYRTGYGFFYNSALPNAGEGLVDQKKVKACCVWPEEKDEHIVLKTPQTLAACDGNADYAAYVLSAWLADTEIDTEGGVYRISFDYKMNHAIGRDGRVIIQTTKGDKTFLNQGLEDCDSEWKPFVGVVLVPKGNPSFRTRLQHSGVGELRFRNFTVVKEIAKTPVTLTSCVHGQVDKTFAVGAGQIGCITYMWKRRLDEAKYEPGKFTFRLTLPAGFEFVAASWGKKGDGRVVRRPDGSSVVDLPCKGREIPTTSYKDSNWSRFGILVRAAEDAKPGDGTFEALYEGKTVSNLEPTRWFVIPAVRVSAKPKRYRNGCFPGSLEGVFKDDPESTYAYAKIMTDAGADWWIHSWGPGPELAAIYRRAGFSVLTPQTCALRDGYHVNGGVSPLKEAGRPAADRFVARSLPEATTKMCVCPFAVIEERPYFMTNTVPRLAEQLRGCDGHWANWEPYTYRNEGCMCDHCRVKFAEFIGMAPEKMTAELWQREVKDGGKWEKENRAFRSQVHGRMIQTIDRHVRKMTGGEKSYGLIPGVAWCEMSSYWRPNNYPPEVKPIDYAGALKWVDPWGPYPFWNLDCMFTATEGFNVAYWFAAKDVREQVNRDYPAGNRPKLMAFPQGAMSCEWITQPEWLGLGLDSFFFNGWEASVVYFFPKGYDARYWRAFAEATERAAKYEDFVFDGRRCDAEVTLSTPGYAKRLKGRVSQYLPAADVSLVQYAAYERGGRLIVAVLNFADAEGAAVEISHPVYGRAKGFVPASRCRVFELGK